MWRKFSFWKDNVLATWMVFAVLGFLAMLSEVKIFDAFNPIEETFSDIEVTDIVFSKIRQDPQPDTNIVLVNISTISRFEIARQLEIIRQHDPAAVGLDVFFFDQQEDVLGDMYLADQLKNTPNLVTVSRLEPDENGNFKKIHYSDSLFIQNGDIGFANLNTQADFQKDYKTCRVFPVSWKIKDETHYPFALELVRKVDPQKADIFLARDKENEVINYRGNIAMPLDAEHYPISFYTLDAQEVLQGRFQPGMLRNKIVLLGYMGDYVGDASWEDRFYTPLNKKYAGKTNPDMYGVVIHANIISMILNETYINQYSDRTNLGLVVAFIVTFLNLTFFSVIHIRLKKYYDLITKSFQILEVMVLLYISVIALNYLDIKLSMTIIITSVILSGDLLEIYYNSLGPISRGIGRLYHKVSGRLAQWKLRLGKL